MPLMPEDAVAKSAPVMESTADATPLVPSRRRFVGAAALGAMTAAGASVMSLVDPLVRAGAWAAGSDKPEKEEVRIGFIPLTDCASVVMASVLGFDKEVRHQDRADEGIELAGRARQVAQRRARRGARAVRDDLRSAARHQRHEEGHGRADDHQQQRPGHHAVEETGRQGRRRRSVAGQDHQERKRRVHVRADLPDRHARDVAVLLARGVGHRSVQGREGDQRAAAADGGQHAGRQHGRFLRRRTVEPSRDPRRHRGHRDHDAGHLGRTIRRRCSARSSTS